MAGEPRKQTLTVLETVGAVYRETAVVRAGDEWRTDRPFHLTLELGTILGG